MRSSGCAADDLAYPRLFNDSSLLACGYFLFTVPVSLADLCGYVRKCEFPDLLNSMPIAVRAVLLVGIFYGIVFFASRQANEFIFFQF